jgi:hypothetical protein
VASEEWPGASRGALQAADGEVHCIERAETTFVDSTEWKDNILTTCCWNTKQDSCQIICFLLMHVDRKTTDRKMKPVSLAILLSSSFLSYPTPNMVSSDGSL